MGRPRKPTAVLELTGAFRKNPQRKRTEPPTAGPLGDPPEHFTAEQAAVWHELASICPPGVLMRSDRVVVEIHGSRSQDHLTEAPNADRAASGRGP
jgi:hypothetical protein